jgi:hypothetical protein
MTKSDVKVFLLMREMWLWYFWAFMLLKKEIEVERVFFPVDFVCMLFVYWFEVFCVGGLIFWGYKCVLDEKEFKFEFWD